MINVAERISWEEAIVAVLQDTDESLHYSEITNRILMEGLCQTESQNPEKIVFSKILSSIKQNNGKSPFIDKENGLFELRNNEEKKARARYGKGKRSKAVAIRHRMEKVPEGGYKVTPKMELTPDVLELMKDGTGHQYGDRNGNPKYRQNFIAVRELVSNADRKSLRRQDPNTRACVFCVVNIGDKYTYMFHAAPSKAPQSAKELFINMLSPQRGQSSDQDKSVQFNDGGKGSLFNISGGYPEIAYQAVFAVEENHFPNDIFDISKGNLAIQKNDPKRKMHLQYTNVDEEGIVQEILTTISKTIVKDKAYGKDIRTRGKFLNYIRNCNVIRIARSVEPTPFDRDYINIAGISMICPGMEIIAVDGIIYNEKAAKEKGKEPYTILTGLPIIAAPYREEWYEEACLPEVFNFKFESEFSEEFGEEYEIKTEIGGELSIHFKKEGVQRGYHETHRYHGGGITIFSAMNQNVEKENQNPRWNTDSIYNPSFMSVESWFKELIGLEGFFDFDEKTRKCKSIDVTDRIFFELNIKKATKVLPNGDIILGANLPNVGRDFYTKNVEKMKDVYDNVINVVKKDKKIQNLVDFAKKTFVKIEEEKLDNIEIEKLHNEAARYEFLNAFDGSVIRAGDISITPSDESKKVVFAIRDKELGNFINKCSIKKAKSEWWEFFEPKSFRIVAKSEKIKGDFHPMIVENDIYEIEIPPMQAIKNWAENETKEMIPVIVQQKEWKKLVDSGKDQQEILLIPRKNYQLTEEASGEVINFPSLYKLPKEEVCKTGKDGEVCQFPISKQPYESFDKEIPARIRRKNTGNVNVVLNLNNIAVRMLNNIVFKKDRNVKMIVENMYNNMNKTAEIMKCADVAPMKMMKSQETIQDSEEVKNAMICNLFAIELKQAITKFNGLNSMKEMKINQKIINDLGKEWKELSQRFKPVYRN